MEKYFILVIALPFVQAKWTGASPKLDCQVRELAYSYGKSLAPQYGQFESLYIALGLNDDCRQYVAPPKFSEADRNVAPPTYLDTSSDGISYFVDYTKGNDSGSGSIDTPYKSIQAAVDAASGKAGVVINLREGTHYLTNTVRITPSTQNLTIQNYKGESVTVSGGRPINGAWVSWNKDDKKNIYVLNTNGSGLTEAPGFLVNGKRAIRARYPNGNPEIPEEWKTGKPGPLSSVHTISPNDATFGLPPKLNSTDYLAPNKYARNSSTLNTLYTVGFGGACSVFSPPVSYWCSSHTQGGGATTFQMISSITPNHTAGLHTPYKNLEEAIVGIYHPRRWANWFFKIGQNSSGELKFSSGGFQGARGRNVGGSWYIENVLEELDFPNEFYWDKADDKLYYFYNGTGSPPKEAIYEIPVLRTLFTVNETQANPVRNFALKGLTLTGTRSTYLDQNYWGIPSAGDWALDRVAAVFLEGTENATVQNCNLTRLDGNGIAISGYNRDTIIHNNSISFMGATAILTWGKTNETSSEAMYGFDGTDGNHPLRTVVSGNVISEVGIYVKQASCYFQAKAAFSTLKGNICFNGPRAGVNLNDGFGGGDIMKNNLLFSLVRETAEHGPFNSWDRQPFWTTYGTTDGSPSILMAWREIHNNFIFDNYHAISTIDNDDGSAYYRTHDNVLIGGFMELKSDFGGHDNYHYDNICFFPLNAIGITSPQIEGHGDKFLRNTVILKSNQISHYPGFRPPALTGPGALEFSNNTFYTQNGTIKFSGEKLDPSTNNLILPYPSDDVLFDLLKKKLNM